MFKTAADVGKGLRKQIVPMMKSKGFNLRVTTSKESYYHDGNVRVQITKVPTNFPVWIDEYSKWRVTPNAERLVQTIKERIGVLVEQLVCRWLGADPSRLQSHRCSLSSPKSLH